MTSPKIKFDLNNIPPREREIVLQLIVENQKLVDKMKTVRMVFIDIDIIIKNKAKLLEGVENSIFVKEFYERASRVFDKFPKKKDV